MDIVRDLKLVVLIADEPTRSRFLRFLREVKSGSTFAAKVPGYQLAVSCCDSITQAIDCVRCHLAADESRAAAILLFDVFDSANVNRESDAREGPHWAAEVQREAKARCATIGIARTPRRVRDIDRVIGRNASSEQLFDALKLVTDRIRYTSAPQKQNFVTHPEVRLIRRQHELLEYFKLRHRVYRIMGYLEEEVENAASQMEINWCDKTALHIGAYERVTEQRDSLIGTARVVVGTSADVRRECSLLASYDEWVTKLASQDPVLQRSLDVGVLPFQLPIFQSQKLFKIFREALRQNEVCGELSRVIVTEKYRGAGVARCLVEFALLAAEKAGVNRMFLECLDIHQSLYKKLGFERIQEVPGIVIGVNQTMIAMELSRRLGAARFASATAS
jgi:N-acetylglutamate synthase-like GNAT family acetyltransferase